MQQGALRSRIDENYGGESLFVSFLVNYEINQGTSSFRLVERKGPKYILGVYFS